MTELSAYGVRAHEAGVLGVTWCCSLTEGAYIFRALRVDMLSGLSLEALYGGRGGWFGVGDNNGIGRGSGLQNHLQSSGEHNTSSAHSRSTLLVSPSLATLSQHRVKTISFSCGKGRDGSGLAGEGVGLLGQLRERIDYCVGGGERISGGGSSGGVRGPGVGPRVGWGTDILLVILHCSLHWTISVVVGLPLLLQ